VFGNTREKLQIIGMSGERVLKPRTNLKTNGKENKRATTTTKKEVSEGE
jgi:hypothetical protein